MDEFEILTPVGEQRFGILPLVFVKKLDFNIVDFANFYSSVTVIDLPYGFVSFYFLLGQSRPTAGKA